MPRCVHRLPVDAADPGQGGHVTCGGHHELVGVALLIGEVGEAVHPPFERHAHAHEVAVHDLADAGEPGARIPQPAQGEQDPGDHQQRLSQGEDVVAVAQLADDERAEDERDDHEEQQDAVDQIDAVAVRARRALGGHQEDHGERDQGSVAHRRLEQGAELAPYRTGAGRPR